MNMNNRPRTGETGQLEFKVTEQHVIDFADEVMPRILSTPWLIWFLEHAARGVVVPYLEPDESTVGAVVEVKHLAPAPVGALVTCHAKIIYRDKNMFSFDLRATDEHEIICRGTHKLRVIRKARLASAVSAKGLKP
jgi:fluoroacetyl-CoA thioesterase